MNQNSMDIILDALDVAELPDKEQQELLEELNEVVFRGTTIRLLELMDEPTRDEYLTLVEKEADDATIEAFFKEKVPQAGDAYAETVDELADDILAGVGTNQ